MEQRPVDPLFEFDAPQMFVDLTRGLHDYAPPLHRPQDPWFDAVHPQHSRPSDELAQEAHAAVKARAGKAVQQTPGRVPAPERKGSGALLKDKVPSTESAQDPSDKENQDVHDRRPRADVAARRMPMRMLRTKAAPLKKAANAGATKAAIKSAVVPSNRAAQKTEKPTVGLKRKAGQAVQPRNRSLTSELAESGDRRRQPSTSNSAVSIRSATVKSTRVVAQSGTVSKPSKPSEKSDLRDLEVLLARHNKKFKPTHTYEPPQHSVRDVKAWERQTKQSYYKLTSEGRVKANQEIAAWLKSQQQRAN